MEKIIDYFLFKEMNKNEEHLNRERAIIIFLLAMFSIGVLTIPIYAYLKFNILSGLLFLLLVSSAALLFYFKHTGNLKITAFCFINFFIIFLFFNILANGGLSSSLIIWFTLLPITAIVLDSGLLKYTIIGCVLALITLMLFEYLDIEFQNQMDGNTKIYFAFFNRLNFIMVIIIIVFNYDERKKRDTERLKQSNAELEQFAYIASHDMKAPLRNMISLTQLLSRKIKDKGPEEEKYIDHILSNGYQMNELIQGILDIAKIEKQETLILKEIDLNEVFNKVKSNFSSRLTAKKVVLEAENLPIILANEAQVIQLFQNLIENGIKYNRSETPKIVITQKREDKFLNLYFTDNGIGIAPQYFDKIFEMFKRLHSGYEFKGTGIGLAICKKIALRHKGDLTVENSSDAGTVFKLSLPI